MKFTIVASALIGLAAAVPALPTKAQPSHIHATRGVDVKDPEKTPPSKEPATPVYFYATAFSSHVPINGKRISAADGFLWLGMPTKKICPGGLESCPEGPDGDGTLFKQGKTPDTIDLGSDTVQHVYINRKTGALQFTTSKDESTDGGITTGFTWIGDTGHDHKGLLKFTHSLVACPQTNSPFAPIGTVPFQLFAQLQGLEFASSCSPNWQPVTGNGSRTTAVEYI